jgi:hypothetical protein
MLNWKLMLQQRDGENKRRKDLDLTGGYDVMNVRNTKGELIPIKQGIVRRKKRIV